MAVQTVLDLTLDSDDEVVSAFDESALAPPASEKLEEEFINSIPVVDESRYPADILHGLATEDYGERTATIHCVHRDATQSFLFKGGDSDEETVCTRCSVTSRHEVYVHEVKVTPNGLVVEEPSWLHVCRACFPFFVLEGALFYKYAMEGVQSVSYTVNL